MKKFTNIDRPLLVSMVTETEIKSALATLLRAVADKEIIELDKETIDSSTVRGAVKIYEYNE